VTEGPFAGGRAGSNSPRQVQETEGSVLNEQGHDYNYVQAKANAALTRAHAEGQHTNNRLKEDLARHVFLFMCWWCVVVVFGLLYYMNHQVKLNLPIPETVALAMLTSMTIVVGLVGFILKGLFGVNDKS